MVAPVARVVMRPNAAEPNDAIGLSKSGSLEHAVLPFHAILAHERPPPVKFPFPVLGTVRRFPALFRVPG
jgi:hypothetical protein